MTILDTVTGRAITTLPIGAHADGAAFDGERADAFSSNGDGTLTVVHESDPDHFAVAQTVKTAPGAKTIALDGVSHKIYLSASSTDRASAPQDSTLPGAFVVLVAGSTPTPNL